MVYISVKLDPFNRITTFSKLATTKLRRFNLNELRVRFTCEWA